MTEDITILKNKTVLFAEDDETMRIQTLEVLSMLFEKVFVAADGAEALKIYEDEKPDIILTDIRMPEMDGLQLVENIRKTDYDVSIVLLTSFTEQELLLQAANLSIDGYIVKPITLKVLIETLHKSLKRAKKKHKLVQLQKDIYYNSATKELFRKGNIVSLGSKELELIELLIESYPKTVTKEEISYILWPYDSICESSIKNLVLRIRKKIANNIIVSVRGVGYRLEGLIQ